MAALRSIKIAIFGNFWQALLLTEMQNIARNGKKGTQALHREAEQSFYCHFGNNVQSFIAIFGNYCHTANSYYFWQLSEAEYS